MKRLIALVLSVILLFSTVPTSLFAFAADGVAVGENVTAISTLPDGAADSLTVNSTHADTKLQTVFTTAEVAAMADSNLFSGMTKSRMTWVDGLGNSVSFSDNAGTNSTLGLADGLICNGGYL